MNKEFDDWFYSKRWGNHMEDNMEQAFVYGQESLKQDIFNNKGHKYKDLCAKADELISDQLCHIRDLERACPTCGCICPSDTEEHKHNCDDNLQMTVYHLKEKVIKLEEDAWVSPEIFSENEKLLKLSSRLYIENTALLDVLGKVAVSHPEGCDCYVCIALKTK
jgi:hypothetical protein